MFDRGTCEGTHTQKDLPIDVIWHGCHAAPMVSLNPPGLMGPILSRHSKSNCESLKPVIINKRKGYYSHGRSIKIWDMSSLQCLVSLGGHLHRVCWISLHCGSSGGNKMVTSSLDCALKIWDLDAVLAPDQQVPAVGGLHYVVLRATSTNMDNGENRYIIATNQGWGRSCQLSAATTHSNKQTSAWSTTTWEVISQATSHDGFVEMAAFTLDSSMIVTIDTGHGGQYTVRYSL